MESIRNITNGDFAVEIMERAGISGDILPWRNVLHMGPIPKKLFLDQWVVADIWHHEFSEI